MRAVVMDFVGWSKGKMNVVVIGVPIHSCTC